MRGGVGRQSERGHLVVPLQLQRPQPRRRPLERADGRVVRRGVRRDPGGPEPGKESERALPLSAALERAAGGATRAEHAAPVRHRLAAREQLDEGLLRARRVRALQLVPQLPRAVPLAVPACGADDGAERHRVWLEAIGLHLAQELHRELRLPTARHGVDGQIVGCDIGRDARGSHLVQQLGRRLPLRAARKRAQRGRVGDAVRDQTVGVHISQETERRQALRAEQAAKRRVVVDLVEDTRAPHPLARVQQRARLPVTPKLGQHRREQPRVGEGVRCALL